MANIKNLQMWNTICADARISISKSLFGLRTTATYTLTNSIIDAKSFEYSPADGEHLKRLIDTPKERIADAINGFRPKATVNGNYMAEVCASRDGQFLAVLLLQFIRMNYEPVTEVVVFEGDDAKALHTLFE
ncbi:MAG: hypothetical protein IJV44_08640 [Prevotella sp.]|nr:hypothetical protein [Prevotella sp.]MBR1546216.1 hypothetical protein [Prevotella sp.]